jgi:hypothetical protein
MIEIEKKIDELTIEKWIFRYINENLYLDNYVILQRESNRHKKFKTLKMYDRLMTRHNSIEESEVPFNDELKAEVLNKYMSTIKVIKWSERNK